MGKQDEDIQAKLDAIELSDLRELRDLPHGKRQHLLGFLMATGERWRALFTDTDARIDETIGLAFLFDGASSLCFAVNQSHQEVVWDDPKLARMPEPWRTLSRLYVARVASSPAEGLLRMVVVCAASEEQFFVHLRLDLGSGAIQ